VGKNIEQEIEELDGKNVVLVLSKSEDMGEFDKTLLNSLVAKDFHGIVLSITQPHDKIVDMIGEKSAKNFFFIDCISRKGGIAEKGDGCLYIDNPANLTEIGIALTEGLNALPKGKKVFFIDSISTLATYVSKNTFAKFSHFLASKMREHETLGVFMSVADGMDKDNEKTLSQFCDKVIKISEGES
jgi:hypothetical protein